MPGLRWVLCALIAAPFSARPAFAQLQNATPTAGANITTRQRVGGADASAPCKAHAECSSGNFFDYNRIDLTVNFRTAGGAVWTPSAAQMTTIQGYFGPINNTIADATEGQMALGTVTVV